MILISSGPKVIFVPILGLLDCSSTHFCLEMLGVNTHVDLSVIIAFPTYASSTAFDFITALATRDLAVS